MQTSHPDHAWRLRAACAEAPSPEIFDWADAQELGVHNVHVREINQQRFAVAKSYCEICPVLSECEDDAQFFGSTPWGVRGGLSPYDRDLRPGMPLSTPGLTALEAVYAQERAWKAFLEGRPMEEHYTAVGRWLRDEKRRFADRPPDVTWQDRASEDSARGNVNGRPAVLAGSGWVVSQNSTRSVVKVLRQQRPGHYKSWLARSSWLQYDSSIAPRVLLEWPDRIEIE